MLGNILSEMKENELIIPEGRTRFLKSLSMIYDLNTTIYNYQMEL